MRTTLLDAPLDLFKRSHDYRRQMQLSLEPQTRLSPEYIDLFNWCTAFEMKCLGLAVQALIEEKTGYNPNQPRVPAGSSDGGQWSNGGGGGGARKPSPLRKPTVTIKPNRSSPRYRLTPEELDRFNLRAPSDTRLDDLKPEPITGLPRWYVDGRTEPTISPLDFVGAGGVVSAARNIAKTSVAEAVSIVKVLRGRMQGTTAAEESVVKIKKAADTIEEFLGGKPDLAKFSNDGDMMLIKDDISVRFDIVKYGSSKEARPHFQIQKRISPRGARKEKWEDLDQHWYDFQDSRSFIKD